MRRVGGARRESHRRRQVQGPTRITRIGQLRVGGVDVLVQVIQLQINRSGRLPPQRGAGKPLIGRIRIPLLRPDHGAARQVSGNTRYRHGAQSRSLSHDEIIVVDESPVMLPSGDDTQCKVVGDRKIYDTFEVPVQVAEAEGIFNSAAGNLHFAGKLVEFRPVRDEAYGARLGAGPIEGALRTAEYLDAA